MIKIYTLTFTLLNYIEKASFKSSSSHYCVTSYSLHIPLSKFDIIIITITSKSDINELHICYNSSIVNQSTQSHTLV
ncbi:hypothetical protein Hanom_Chr00s005162g01728121 [Helianthus anomalus]